MSDMEAQDFWLHHLGSASRFNEWVFARIRRRLGNRILEIGCGTGNFTALMAADGRSVTAIDRHAPFVEFARRRLGDNPYVRVICGDALEHQWSESFDTVVLLDVLEHIDDHVSFLRSLQNCLTQDGRLVVKVPAGQWLYGPMDKAIGHYRRYSPRSLAAALTAAGFVPEVRSYFNVLGILGWWLNGKVLKRVTPPAEQVGLFDRLVPILRFIETVLPLPMGLSLIAIGTRPVDPVA